MYIKYPGTGPSHGILCFRKTWNVVYNQDAPGLHNEGLTVWCLVYIPSVLYSTPRKKNIIKGKYGREET